MFFLRLLPVCLFLFGLVVSQPVSQKPPDSACTLHSNSSCGECTGVSFSGGGSQLSCMWCPSSSSSSSSSSGSCVPSWWTTQQLQAQCMQQQPSASCQSNAEPAWVWGGVFIGGLIFSLLFFSFIFTHIPKSGIEVTVPDKYNMNKEVLDAGMATSDEEEPIISRQCFGLYRATRSRAFCFCFETRSITFHGVDSSEMHIVTSALPKLLTACVFLVSLFCVLFLVSPVFFVWPYSSLPYALVSALCAGLLLSTMTVWRREVAVLDRKKHVARQWQTRGAIQACRVNRRPKGQPEEYSLANLDRFAMMKMSDITGTSYSLEMRFKDGSRVSILECEALKTIYRTRERVGEFLNVDSHANHLGIAGLDAPAHPPPSVPSGHGRSDTVEVEVDNKSLELNPALSTRAARSSQS